MQHHDDAGRASSDLVSSFQESALRSGSRRRRLAAGLAAVARRRRRRGSVTAMVLAASVAVAAPLAVGHSKSGGASSSSPSVSASVLERGAKGSAVRALQRKLGIAADGVYGPATARAVRRFQRRSGLAVDGVAGPATLSALGLRSTSRARPRSAPAASLKDPAAVLAAIAQCESGGNPRAVSANGRYRGKYQFRRATWKSLGGKGDPAKAPEAEQDRLAAKLLAQRGTAPWPACSRKLHRS